MDQLLLSVAGIAVSAVVSALLTAYSISLKTGREIAGLQKDNEHLKRDADKLEARILRMEERIYGVNQTAESINEFGNKVLDTDIREMILEIRDCIRGGSRQ